LAIILRRQVQQDFSARGEDISIVDVTLGYQIRGAPPIQFDIDYTRTLRFNMR
jgi:6-phosphofructokinase